MVGDVSWGPGAGGGTSAAEQIRQAKHQLSDADSKIRQAYTDGGPADGVTAQSGVVVARNQAMVALRMPGAIVHADKPPSAPKTAEWRSLTKGQWVLGEKATPDLKDGAKRTLTLPAALNPGRQEQVEGSLPPPPKGKTWSITPSTQDGLTTYSCELKTLGWSAPGTRPSFQWPHKGG
jgi:hypothetical protein